MPITTNPASGSATFGWMVSMELNWSGLNSFPPHIATRSRVRFVRWALRSPRVLRARVLILMAGASCRGGRDSEITYQKYIQGRANEHGPHVIFFVLTTKTSDPTRLTLPSTCLHSLFNPPIQPTNPTPPCFVYLSLASLSYWRRSSY